MLYKYDKNIFNIEKLDDLMKRSAYATYDDYNNMRSGRQRGEERRRRWGL